MSNLDVTLAGFWQLARHWKQGHRAKLELACENGNLQMNLSGNLGHPDHLHFPKPPPPPNPCPNFPPREIRKSPSYMRRQERRRQKAKEASPSANNSATNSDKEIIVESSNNQKSAEEPTKVFTEKLTEETVEESFHLLFQCDQCEYTNATEKGLSQHKRMKHRISKIDGMDDLIEEVAEKAHTGLYKCDVCNFRTDVEEEMNNHINVKHIEKNHRSGL